MMWFTKSRRAQSKDDYETWVEAGVCPTLNAFDNAHETRATVVIAFDNSYRDGIRLQKGSTVNTLSAKMGTGGNNVPFIARDVIPIQDGREMEKRQNGLGVGDAGAPSYTLDQTGAQSVAVPIQGTIIGRADTAGPQGRGAGEPGDPMYTLDTVSQHGVEHMMQVRRLTPIECERLMGWPDDHTAVGVNGQVADSNRYKMCGNGVASPVAQWIGEQLMQIVNPAPARSFMDMYIDSIEEERARDRA